MNLPIVRSRSPLYVKRRLFQLTGQELARQYASSTVSFTFDRDVRQRKRKSSCRRAHRQQTCKKSPLVHTLVPRPQILRVQSYVGTPQWSVGRQRAEQVAQVLPRVLGGGNGQAADGGRWQAAVLRVGVVELCQERLEAQGEHDVFQGAVGCVPGEEVAGDEEVCEAEGEGVFKNFDGL